MSSSESGDDGVAQPPAKRQRRFAFKNFQQRVSQVCISTNGIGARSAAVHAMHCGGRCCWAVAAGSSRRGSCTCSSGWY